MLQYISCPFCNRTIQLDSAYVLTDIVCPFCNNHIYFNNPVPNPYNNSVPYPYNNSVPNPYNNQTPYPYNNPIPTPDNSPPPPTLNDSTNAPSSKISLSLNDLGLETPASQSVSGNNTPVNRAAGGSSPAASSTSAPAAEPARRLSPRQRRLLSDEQETREYFKNFPLINIVDSKGNPVNQYIIEYLVQGIERLEHNNPVYRNRHLVEIVLDGAYPRTPPKCRMLTPIFHPNIEPAVICIGDHWTAQERLCHLIVRIGEIITYQSYNIHSPLDGLAAQWADLHPNFLPVDSRSLLPDF